MNPKLKAVERDPAEAVCSAVVKAGTGWLHEVRAGQILRIVDLCGNQSADVLLYNAHDTAERYKVNNTIAAQRSTMIELGTELRSNDDNVMFTVVADTCGEHDTLGAAVRRRAMQSVTPTAPASCTAAATPSCATFRTCPA